jgi:hypothetical protein
MRKNEESATVCTDQQSRRGGASGAILEKRGTLRYALRASVIFAWEDASGARREYRGHTRDVGQKGAFIIASECPPKGTPVSLSIFLPGAAAETPVLRMEAQGRVLRAERVTESTEGPGFAVSHQRVNLFSN